MLGGLAWCVTVVIVVGLGACRLGRCGSSACGASSCCGASRLAGCGLGQSLIALQIAHVLCGDRRTQFWLFTG